MTDSGLRPWVGVEAFNAHHTRVREPELRASTAQQGFIVEKQTGEGPKPCGSDPLLMPYQRGDISA